MGRLLVDTCRSLAADDAPQWAAAISYYAILSLFPLLLSGVSIAAYFVDPERATRQAVRFLAEYLPENDEQIRELVQGVVAARGTVSLVSLLVFLWSGSRVFDTLTRALNLFFGVPERYGFWKRRMIELTMLLSVGLLFLVSLSSRLVMALVLQNAAGFLPLDELAALEAMRRLVSTLLLLLSFFVLYTVVPRRAVNWRSSLTGALAATLLFSLARPLFAVYLQRFAAINLVYGSAAIVIILLLWVWVAAMITLIGAELASHVQRMFIEDAAATPLQDKTPAPSQTGSAPPAS